MKRIALLATGLMLLGGFAHAQSNVPSGRGATTGDPAASSANPNAAPPATVGSDMKKPSRSGSGTSTSGGSDANGDQGLGKMPDEQKRQE